MKMRKQRLLGLGLILISTAMLALATTGKTPEERDATAVLLTLPLGIYALVTKECILYDASEDTTKARAGPRRKQPHTHQRTRYPQPCGYHEQYEKGAAPWQEHAS